ncbi:hypothetical protein Y032_0065g3661 [Ancylostoma ceylanicum]|uniref:Uncharacterized protein n=1 Tax=Ancylostoma ceylanicum TaxID=53326 RepID=A0A016U0Z2_9BILA|nr:hypothetical protein Y032_0065g3661 [Ancylostoma ceylanicum]
MSYLQFWIKNRRSKIRPTFVHARIPVDNKRNFFEFMRKGRLASLRCFNDYYVLHNVAGDELRIKYRNGLILINSEDE